jgi:ankyrin repeat protein
MLTPIQEKFLNAAKEGDIDRINELLSEDKDPINAKLTALMNVKDEDNQWPLYLAAEGGHDEVIKLLLENGADAKAIDTSGDNEFGVHYVPLISAIENCKPETVKLLLDRGADVHLNSQFDLVVANQTPLCYAIEKGNLDIIKVILERKPDINLGNVNNYTPLHLAVEQGKLDIIKLILEHKPDTEVQEEIEHNSPLTLALDRDEAEIAELLIKYGANVNSKHGGDNWTPLHCAVYDCDIKTVKLLIVHGADIYARDNKGRTPLHYAAKFGIKEQLLNIKNIEHLIEKGVPINSTDNKGRTIIHYAAMGGKNDIIEFFKSSFSDINAKDETCKAPLYYAAKFGQIETVKLLLARGADVNATDNQGRTPLHKAVRKNHSKSDEVVKLLLAQGADVNAIDSEGKTYLHHAVFLNSFDSDKRFEGLLGLNMDINAIDNKGKTPLHYAVERAFKSTCDQKRHIVGLLLNKGCTIPNDLNFTSISIAGEYTYKLVERAKLTDLFLNNDNKIFGYKYIDSIDRFNLERMKNSFLKNGIPDNIYETINSLVSSNKMSPEVKTGLETVIEKIAVNAEIFQLKDVNTKQQEQLDKQQQLLTEQREQMMDPSKKLEGLLTMFPQQFSPVTPMQLSDPSTSLSSASAIPQAGVANNNIPAASNKRARADSPQEGQDKTRDRKLGNAR